MRLFPHESVRLQQDHLVTAVNATLDARGKLVAHAPTGLGKTAATLVPAIEHAIDQRKIVIFMTSRLTQHRLALQTIEKIRERHGVRIPIVDLIGKKHLCLQPGVMNLSGKEFADYCRTMREDGLCEHYTRLKKGEMLSQETEAVLVQLGHTSPNTPEQVRMVCALEENQLCPYEVTMLMAKDSTVIVCDYSYLFNPSIREGFFRRINRELKDCILIVDEAHNLPDRIKELGTERISSGTIRRALKELEQFKQDEHLHHVQQIGEAIELLCKGVDEETFVDRDLLIAAFERVCDPAQLSHDLDKVAMLVREEQKSSSCGAIAQFIDAWSSNEDGFTRILSVRKQDEQHPLFGRPGVDWQLSYRCLDASVISRPVLDAAYASILMSGTLTPVEMYAKLLGADDAQLLTLESPFPRHNRRNLIVPKTTTKYTSRSAGMFNEISSICTQIVHTVPGNCAIFFPSYHLLEQVRQSFVTATHRTVFCEHASLTKEEREDLLNRFRGYKESGAVLLGVMGGSFSEGIDLPGSELRTVIIVGLPLGRPDLETKALIDYYQERFGKGWEYGYTFPAFNKTLQSAGRCIRTEKDRGVIVFLDERYAWQNYYRCFPKEWDIKITLRYEDVIAEFFAQPAEEEPLTEE